MTPASGALPPAGPATPGLLAPQDIVEIALAASRTDGCIVIVQPTSRANVRWANNTVTTNGVSDTLTWWVIAVQGGAAGTVAASASAAGSREQVAETVRQAEDAARAAAQAGPAQDLQPLVGTGDDSTGTDDAAFATAPAQTSFAVYRDLLPTLGAAFGAARSRDEILYGFARHEQATTYLGTSTGLRRRWVQPTGTVELNAKSADLARSSWSALSTADFVGVDVSAMADNLSERLGWSTRQIELPAGRYDTLLPPTAVADFMIPLVWRAGARAAHEGRSPFSAPGGGTRAGERLTDQALSLYTDPLADGIETAPFVVAAESSEDLSVFDNGAPVGRTTLVQGGAVGSLAHTRASAQRYDEPFTPVTDNLTLIGGDQRRTTADLIAGLERGLLLTSQWYLREVDPQSMLTTGVTRDGVFLVEGGEIVGACNNFRFNMSPLDVLRRAGDVGATQPTLSREWSDWFTRTAMPPMVVHDFVMSSVSQAK
ncbi:TldD/PmbA family protein [Nakamurella flavida]|uniref:TldD/PmbA family protein n=1 Tax=Nakamurella flavida TaxID=363630 RepID=A0A939C4V1_9ACTN|nr:metallopeptidase TldD-related protein [Nakamurella flavida]MBM9475592.1 TldD/PmbA family protein [Nakamurella flavida]MDP9778132.1 putative Zn-dependent protease [Nakamurella flavida]